MDSQFQRPHSVGMWTQNTASSRLSLGGTKTKNGQMRERHQLGLVPNVSMFLQVGKP